MLNLLFISDSPKAEYIRSALQPLLKVIIDVVTDFDHGLKEVFEKRPTTVCIQDQIGGVTGESVARHIQMLLGNSAPTFILLHNGDGKARTIKGLFEHLIDLSQSNETVAEEIKSTLKLLLGDQWKRIYIPPKRTPASVRSSVAAPEGSRKDADKLVNDFLSDLETSGFSTVDHQPPVTSTADNFTEESSADSQSKTPPGGENTPGTVAADRAQAISDDLAELLLMERNRAGRDKISAAGDGAGSVPFDSPRPSTAGVTLPPPVITGPPASTETHHGITPLTRSVASTPEKKDTKGISASATAPPPPPAAEFRISQNIPQAEEQIPEDLLLEFEENYRSESLFFRRTVVIALVCAFCAAGGWYLVKQKPQLISSLKQRLVPSPGSRPAPLPVPSLPPVQKPLPPPVLQPVMTPPLPTFIPKNGHDRSFAVKNHGWERYVGKLNEFRVFSASGRIQALQVLAVKDASISDSFIKSVLQEFAGSPEYQITSRSTKAGVRVESGRTDNKGEIMIYRKNGGVKAFVVSVH